MQRNEPPDIKESLEIISSCEEPYDWIEQEEIISSESAWDLCYNSEWFIYLLSRLSLEEHKLEKIVCDIILEYIPDDISKNKVSALFSFQKQTNITSLESKQEINNFIGSCGLDKNLLLSVVSSARILFYNHSSKKIILPLSDSRDIYLAPFRYLEKYGIAKKELSLKIKNRISFKEIQDIIVKYKQHKTL
jgi:hypothetical protein